MNITQYVSATEGCTYNFLKNVLNNNSEIYLINNDTNITNFVLKCLKNGIAFNFTPKTTLLDFKKAYNHIKNIEMSDHFTISGLLNILPKNIISVTKRKNNKCVYILNQNILPS